MKWTPEKVDSLRRRYPDEESARLARDLGCSAKAVALLASRLGIRKSAGFIEARYRKAGVARPGARLDGARRVIATGTVIVRGNVLTHLSNASVHRDT